MQELLLELFDLLASSMELLIHKHQLVHNKYGCLIFHQNVHQIKFFKSKIKSSKCACPDAV